MKSEIQWINTCKFEKEQVESNELCWNLAKEQVESNERQKRSCGIKIIKITRKNQIDQSWKDRKRTSGIKWRLESERTKKWNKIDSVEKELVD